MQKAYKKEEPETTDGGPAVLNETLRDRFAMAALTGLITLAGNLAIEDERFGPDPLARHSYVLADAMLRVREEKTEG